MPDSCARAETVRVRETVHDCQGRFGVASRFGPLGVGSAAQHIGETPVSLSLACAVAERSVHFQRALAVLSCERGLIRSRGTVETTQFQVRPHEGVVFRQRRMVAGCGIGRPALSILEAGAFDGPVGSSA